MRPIALALIMLAGASAVAFAEDEQSTDTQALPPLQRDGFVVNRDACGASRYSHLVGRDYGEVTQASLLPADSSVPSVYRLTTLEYRPAKLNVVVNGEGRIIAIGCF